jgi:hypothetical protein
MKIFKNLSFAVAAGCVGGLVKALTAVAFTDLGINLLFGSYLSRALSPQLLYEHVVWGGIWGLLFLLPLRRHSYYWRGVLIGLGQSGVQLSILFPIMGQGFLGLGLGYGTPFLVLFFGALWGLTAGFWLKLLQGD